MIKPPKVRRRLSADTWVVSHTPAQPPITALAYRGEDRRAPDWCKVF